MLSEYGCFTSGVVTFGFCMIAVVQLAGAPHELRPESGQAVYWGNATAANVVAYSVFQQEASLAALLLYSVFVPFLLVAIFAKKLHWAVLLLASCIAAFGICTFLLSMRAWDGKDKDARFYWASQVGVFSAFVFPVFGVLGLVYLFVSGACSERLRSQVRELHLMESNSVDASSDAGSAGRLGVPSSTSSKSFSTQSTLSTVEELL